MSPHHWNELKSFAHTQHSPTTSQFFCRVDVGYVDQLNVLKSDNLGLLKFYFHKRKI